MAQTNVVSSILGNDCDEQRAGLSAPAPRVEFELEEEYFCGESNREEQPMDEDCFPSFAPLLHACQEYATLSGCRFIIADFNGIEHDQGHHMPIVSESRAQDTGPVLAGKLRAFSAVRSFADRLRGGEAELHRDLGRAFSTQMRESARNSMIASCKAADFFPPVPAPTSVDDKDCSWDEVGLASVPVIAQRLFNDELRRVHDRRDLMRAKTASFIVDFASETGAELPEPTTECTDMLQQFHRELSVWADRLSKDPRLDIASPEARTWMECKDGRELATKLKAKQAEIMLGVSAFAMLGVVGLAAHTAGRNAMTTANRSRGSRSHFQQHVPV